MPARERSETVRHSLVVFHTRALAVAVRVRPMRGRPAGGDSLFRIVLISADEA